MRETGTIPRGQAGGREKANAPTGPGGLAGWVLARLRTRSPDRPRLALVEKISVAPRQTLCLVEAEGRHFLFATSPEGSPAFLALDSGSRRGAQTQRRISW